MGPNKEKREKVDMDVIANLLGVSKTTVHYAIRRTGRLSDRTRKRVLKMVDSMGYRPDRLARCARPPSVGSIAPKRSTIPPETPRAGTWSVASQRPV